MSNRRRPTTNSSSEAAKRKDASSSEVETEMNLVNEIQKIKPPRELKKKIWLSRALILPSLIWSNGFFVDFEVTLRQWWTPACDQSSEKVDAVHTSLIEELSHEQAQDTAVADVTQPTVVLMISIELSHEQVQDTAVVPHWWTLSWTLQVPDTESVDVIPSCDMK